MWIGELSRAEGTSRQRPVLSSSLLTLIAATALLPCCSTARALSLPPQAQATSASATVPRGKKLIMKDGSFQVVSSYELEEDRVRYFSVERAEWEEIPASLVDWPATKQAEASQAKADASLANTLRAEEARAKATSINVDASVEVAPGVFLPPGDGFFILDGGSVFQLQQSSASAKLAKGHFVEQIAVPIPVIPSRTSVDLPGKHASFRITNSSPEFYLRTPDLDEPEVELIMARIRGNKRHIENIDTLFGEQEHKGKTIALQEWRVAKGLYRFTLGQPLRPGEYALAQFSPKQELNLLLWDFGVDARRRDTNQK